MTGLCLSDSLHERIGVLPCSEPVCLSVSVLQALSGVIHLSGAVSAALSLSAWGFSLFCLSLSRGFCSQVLASCLPIWLSDSYLVDPASSHMLVSKIKPCMSQFTLSHGETANGSLNRSRFLRRHDPTWITVAILELIHASKLRPVRERALLLAQNQSPACLSEGALFGDSG